MSDFFTGFFYYLNKSYGIARACSAQVWLGVAYIFFFALALNAETLQRFKRVFPVFPYLLLTILSFVLEAPSIFVIGQYPVDVPEDEVEVVVAVGALVRQRRRQGAFCRLTLGRYVVGRGQVF